MNQTQVKADTERARVKALAELRHGRLETGMIKQIDKAWAQLDVAVDEIVRLGNTIKLAKREGDDKMVTSFEQTLLAEKAKALGKAEILALLMPGPLDSPEAISQESGRRYAMRQRGEEPTTPGIRQAAGTMLGGVAPGRILTEAEAAAKR